MKEAFASSKNFVVDITDASGTVTAVSQSAFADGADPTVTTADYSVGLKEVEKYYINTICVDTEDAAVHALVAAWLDRIYLAGSFAMAIVAPKPSSSLEDRMTSISSFDTENVIAPLNANANAGNEELKGYQVAGGKTMVTFLFDSVFTWVVVVPVAFLLAHGTGLGIVSVYFLVQATELIKVVIGYCMVRSNVWVVKMV